MADLFDLMATLSLDDTDYVSGLDAAEDKAQSFGSGLSNVMQTGVSAISAVGSAVVNLGASFVGATGDVAAYGDSIDKTSQMLGISAEAYQEWSAILQHSGTSIDAMRGGMRALTSAVDKGSESFEVLGISQEQIASMSQEELFSATITALQGVEDETERTILAQSLLGRGAQQMGALLNTSAEETEEMRQRVHELGGVMSDEAVSAAASYQDSLQDMQTAFSGLSRNMTAEFLPSLTTVMDGITNIFAGDSSGMGMISEGISGIAEKINESIPQITNVVSGLVTTFGDVIIQSLPTLAESGGQILQTLGDNIIENLPMIIDTATDIIMRLASGIIDNLPTIIQTSMDIMVALANGLSENLPTLIPKVTLMITQIAKTLTSSENIRNIVKSAITLIRSLATGLIEALPVLINAIPEITTELLNGIIESLPFILNALPGLITEIVNAIVENAPLLLNAVITVVSMVMESAPEILEGIVNALPDILIALVNGIISVFTTLLPQLIEGLITLGATIATHIPDIFKSVIDAIPRVLDAILIAFEPIVEFLGNLFQNARDAVKTKLEEAWAKIEEFFQPLIDFVRPIIDSLSDLIDTCFTAIKKVIGDVMDGAKEKISEIWNGIVDFITPILDGISSFFEQTFTDIYNFIKQPLEDAWDFITEIFNNIKDFISGILDDAWTWGADLIDNFVDGIKSGITKVGDTIEGIAQDIRDFIGFSEPKLGPLSDFHSFAPDMMDLFAEGVEQNAGVVTGAVSSAFDLGGAITGGMGKSTGLITPSASEPVTVVLQVNETQLGKVVFNLNRRESQRIGVDLGEVVTA